MWTPGNVEHNLKVNSDKTVCMLLGTNSMLKKNNRN